jgi:hypothetical protein
MRIALILDTFEFSTASEPSIDWIFVWVGLLGQICPASRRTGVDIGSFLWILSKK